MERDRNRARLLAAGRAALDADDASVECASALPWLARQPPDAQWDVVFLDPPFDADLHAQAVAAVAPRLAAGGVVYVEAAADARLADLARGAGLEVRRKSRVGGVRYGLLAGE